MEELGITFDFERAMTRCEGARQHHTQRARSALGNPRHDVVCRFWLVGTCRMGDECYFLHRYFPDKIPLCAYIDAPQCAAGTACVFRHYYNPGEKRGRVFADASRMQSPSVVASATAAQTSFWQITHARD